MFFGGVLGLSLGALGYSLRSAEKESRPAEETTPLFLLGETERLMVLSAIAGLFTLFLTLQVSYLFGDVARVQGSGVSYAEWARRGFTELTVVATLCGGVILALALTAPATRWRRAPLMWSLSSSARLGLFTPRPTGGAVRERVRLHDDPSLRAGVHDCRAASRSPRSLVLRQPSARRLLGRAGALAVMAMTAVSVWNHEGWIVRQNVARYAHTGKLDVRYLACELSARAVPEVLQAAQRVDVGTAALAREVVRQRFAGRLDDAWYEWNVGRSRAREAITQSGIAPPPGDRSFVLCHRKW